MEQREELWTDEQAAQRLGLEVDAFRRLTGVNRARKAGDKAARLCELLSIPRWVPPQDWGGGRRWLSRDIETLFYVLSRLSHTEAAAQPAGDDSPA